jgi:hypothetical protein
MKIAWIFIWTSFTKQKMLGIKCHQDHTLREKEMILLVTTLQIKESLNEDSLHLNIKRSLCQKTKIFNNIKLFLISNLEHFS